MDKLKSLGTSLPPEQPPTDENIETLNTEISNEFKNAANSVAKLYRLSNEKNSLLRHKGYLNCLEDILNEIEISNGNISITDLKNWCLEKRNDLVSSCNNGGDMRNSIINETMRDRKNFDFKASEVSDITSPKFIKSMPPPSVEYTKPSNNSRRYKKNTVVTYMQPTNSRSQQNQKPSIAHVDKKPKLDNNYNDYEDS
ncbi:hypothetical protein Kpol_1013p25 [Vanderwaltozyma polyspora DSM 70294]|uniref:Uncharacterized protein n=1 Tax=Vanderwaltozyma polyspora (strain ATCC 22028 / DSM 70294 / BCRC 21397 / CBS 2163 / NBRC 10782 / NRRL Y-8283 / UCD 57-17) TaxID=436907 RepID=A7TH73_VANPO|nr:uncharacterized protein Kpol_1013p25 [Vanderwaltozyma polyspora DSM 70294]EDO18354.1 hypothetical protein Kpol_1013p25 [Vanderwaltozyma polyspora DSM 70294]